MSDQKVEIQELDPVTRKPKDDRIRAVDLQDARQMIANDKAQFALKKVCFRVGHGVYNGGEIAGFNSLEASKLIAMGVAVPVTKGKPEPEPPVDTGEPTASKKLEAKKAEPDQAGEATASKKAASRRSKRK